MRTLVHISDLHFGREDSTLLEPLSAAVAEARPDLVVISGDLTQRARRTQFSRARRFLDRLPTPQVVVPGNHDVPLYDVVRRFFRPYHRFRRYVSEDLAPVWSDSELAVVGANTARARAFKSGRINLEQVRRMRSWFDALPEEVVRVVVSHHPFDLPRGIAERNIVGRAAPAVAELATSGIDLFLAGHLHSSHAGSTAERHRIAGYAAVFVQAGTSLSTRLRGEANGFNVLCLEARRIVVERRRWAPESAAFRSAATTTFRREADGWIEARAA